MKKEGQSRRKERHMYKRDEETQKNISDWMFKYSDISLDDTVFHSIPTANKMPNQPSIIDYGFKYTRCA